MSLLEFFLFPAYSLTGFVLADTLLADTDNNEEEDVLMTKKKTLTTKKKRLTTMKKRMRAPLTTCLQS